ncbi:MAG: polymer-forming cytoskeletal protein [Hyphomicrobium sp.]|jgi:cytoskeletal protein CcmA (bactofilin family)|uniref:bactofilin family protein n=2 Tax=Hyphomicrobium TaxID=81 RepID=UPI0025C5AC1E|nr:polymer-forming cytoskeletal protein [Hyphomicrobium sp.]MBX9862096.1 polymer-forming cytoskeletal protein [Hyphomicrobium sp.]|eukprot:c32559_g1_i1.p1 GENE.c32559_g1_i1~~c32559_g1_i1.p1  ORF type:complete len:184 (-),score=23.50 c32559_g1_i1:201-752(-)
MLPQFRKPETDSPQSNISNLSAPPSTLGPRQTAASFRPGGPSGASVIGVDLVIHGNLTSKGEVQIEGEVQGDIHGTHVVIGERARVTGGVIAEECVIRGHLLGTVRGRRVLLQSSSHVEGDIYHQTMAIEQGAFFEGKSRRTDDPLAGVSRPERAQGESSSSSLASEGSQPEPYRSETPPPLV